MNGLMNKWFGPRLSSVGAKLPNLDMIWMHVPPSYTASNQVVKQGQSAKGASSIIDVDVPVSPTSRFVYQRGSQFELVDDINGPIRWHGTGGRLGYSWLHVEWQLNWLNASVDVATAFYLGMRTGGSVPQLAVPSYFKASLDPRGGINLSGCMLVLNGGLAASELWPVISGAGAWAANAIGWTEQNLIVTDTGERI